MLGAIIGDMSGSKYEFNNIKTKDFNLLDKDCYYTDDTIMTLAIAEILENNYQDDNNKVIDIIKKWGRSYPNAGYGARFYDWLFSDNREPYNSCGNGSAMRISAVGWYASSEDEVKEFSKKVTQVTHNHKEGLKGAEITAMCIYYARTGKSKEFIKEYVEQYYSLDFDYDELVKTYYHGAEICQISVPQAIYCFLISNSYEDCIKTTISIGGDCDTTSAISGAIAEAYYKNKDGISKNLLDRMISKLPRAKDGCDPMEVIYKFTQRYDYLMQLDNQEYEVIKQYHINLNKDNHKKLLDLGYNYDGYSYSKFIDTESNNKLNSILENILNDKEFFKENYNNEKLVKFFNDNKITYNVSINEYRERQLHVEKDDNLNKASNNWYIMIDPIFGAVYLQLANFPYPVLIYKYSDLDKYIKDEVEVLKKELSMDKKNFEVRK